MVRLFCPFELAADKTVINVDVVFVIFGIAAAAFVVASTIGISLSVVICVEFNSMLGIMRSYSVYCFVGVLFLWKPVVLPLTPFDIEPPPSN